MRPARPIEKRTLKDMKHRVTLQQRANTSDGMGGESETYTDVASAWAAIANINSYEQVEGFLPKAKVTYRFVMRWQPSWYAYWDFLNGSTAITDGSGHRKNPEMRFKYKNRYFKIINGMDVNEDHRWFEFYCEETV